MYSKSLACSAAAFCVLVALQTPILAQGTEVVRDHRTGAGTTIRDHRVEPTVRDHRTKRRNEVVPVTRVKLDCEVGTVKLERMGYNSIVAYDCESAVYRYTAMDNTSLFRASMSAYTGKMDVQFVGIAGK